MKAIEHIPSASFLTIDIETVRIEEHYENLSEDWKSAWRYKNKNDGVVPSEIELTELWTNNASLYPEFSKVATISLVRLSQGRLKCKSYAGFDEASVLEEFSKDLEAFKTAKQREYYIVAHAGKFFDFPFLAKRFIIHGLVIPEILDETHLKPWERKQICTNELWKAFGGHGASLQALCTALGVPISKVDLVGDEVGKVYFAGDILRIARYCDLDAIAVFNILRKFKREPIFTFEEVEYVNDGVVIKKDDIFKALSKSREISVTHFLEIESLSAKMTLKERKSFSKLILAALDKGEEGLTPLEVSVMDMLSKAAPKKKTQKAA